MENVQTMPIEVMNLHKLVLKMNKPIGLSNRNSKWASIGEVDNKYIEAIEEEEPPNQCLPSFYSRKQPS